MKDAPKKKYERFKGVPLHLMLNFIQRYSGDYEQLPNNEYRCGCPICHEGESWGKNKRLYFNSEKGVVQCHNCGYKSTAIRFIANVSGKEIHKVMKEIDAERAIDEKEVNIDALYSKHLAESALKQDGIAKSTTTIEQALGKKCTLPFDAVDIINDGATVEYIALNQGKKGIIKACKYANDRGLYDCVNPGPLYFSETDFSHSFRLIIPFYGLDGKLTFFQSRSYLERDKERRYIGSYGHSKGLYGIERVDFDAPHLFFQEGPLNCFFLKNSMGLAGISKTGEEIFTAKQREQIKFVNKDKMIFILDNHKIDKTAESKMKYLRSSGYKVFDWPDEMDFSKYKDLNEYCLAKQIPGVDGDFIAKYSF